MCLLLLSCMANVNTHLMQAPKTLELNPSTLKRLPVAFLRLPKDKHAAVRAANETTFSTVATRMQHAPGGEEHVSCSRC